MEQKGQPSCTYKDQTYPNGYTLCTDVICLACKNGEWENEGESASGLF